MPRKVSHVSAADHDVVTVAVAAAEAHTSGEIVTVVAAQSNDYDDVALVWASVVAWPCPCEQTLVSMVSEPAMSIRMRALSNP